MTLGWVTSKTIRTAHAFPRAMHFYDILRTCTLVQAINILRNYRFYVTGLFQASETNVRRVWLCTSNLYSKRMNPIIEFLRVVPEC